MLDQHPPKSIVRWNCPLIAGTPCDDDVQYSLLSLRKLKIDLSRRKSWCESDDPDFGAKAAHVVGLYMAPPENVVVLCINEKPSIRHSNAQS